MNVVKMFIDFIYLLRDCMYFAVLTVFQIKSFITLAVLRRSV